MRDLYASVLPVSTIVPIARTATVTGATVDRYQSGACYQDAMAVLHTGTITDGTFVVTLEDSTDNSSWGTAAAADTEGTVPTVDATGDNSKCFTFRYIGVKRYVRVKVTASGTTTGGVFGCVVLLADPRVLPVTQA